jgi:hypothetical protein
MMGENSRMRVYIIVILVVLLSGFLVVFYFNRSTFAGSSSLTAGNPCPEGIRLEALCPRIGLRVYRQCS